MTTVRDSDAWPADPKRRRILVRVAQVLAAGSVILSLSVIGFIIQTERAHRESVCPFHVVEKRIIGRDLTLTDEARRCEASVEEHRYVLERKGAEPRVIGDRRLPVQFFAAGKYRWRAAMEGGQVRLHIQNDGVEAAEFQEHPPTKHR